MTTMCSLVTRTEEKSWTQLVEEDFIEEVVINKQTEKVLLALTE